MIQSTVFVEEVARCCFNTATICQIALHGPSRAISILGTEAQQRRWLPGVVTGESLFAISISESHAGSAVTELRTRATAAGYGFRRNGAKSFTTLWVDTPHTYWSLRASGTRTAREGSARW